MEKKQLRLINALHVVNVVEKEENERRLVVNVVEQEELLVPRNRLLEWYNKQLLVMYVTVQENRLMLSVKHAKEVKEKLKIIPSM